MKKHIIYVMGRFEFLRDLYLESIGIGFYHHEVDTDSLNLN